MWSFVRLWPCCLSRLSPQTLSRLTRYIALSAVLSFTGGWSLGCSPANGKPCTDCSDAGELLTDGGLEAEPSDARWDEQLTPITPDAPLSERKTERGPEYPPPGPIRCGAPTRTFYEPPAQFPSGASPGTVVKCEEIGGRTASTLGADLRFSVGGGVARYGYRLFRILYVTQYPKGTLRWATALLSTPVEPKGNCRTNAAIAMVGHGTMGMAPQCGPSRFPNFGLHHLTFPLLGRGIAVVSPDFLGLGIGVPEGHPYLITKPTVWSGLDSVRAARYLAERGALPGCVSKKVLLFGHSQGGQAALASASMFSSYLQDYQLLGTVAWGPAFGDERLWLGPFAPTFKVTTATAYFLAYLLAAQRTGKGPALSQWLTPKAAIRISGLLDTVCFAEWDSFLRSQFSTFQDIFTSSFLKASTACNAGKGDCKSFRFWRDVIAASQIPAQPPLAPTLLVQGLLDTVVSATSVSCIAKRWKSGTKVTHACVYPQANHISIISQSWKAILPWIAQILAGKTPATPACPQTKLPVCP